MTADAYRVPDLAPGTFHRTEQIIKKAGLSPRLLIRRHRKKPSSLLRKSDKSSRMQPITAGPLMQSAAGSTTQIGASDDGEPHGTAGKPMLTVLVHCEIGELTAVVTRYFGGTRVGHRRAC